MPGSSMGRSSGRNWAKKIFGKKACIRQAFGVMSPLATGCGSVWLERSVRDAEAARSNRAIPTIKKRTGSSEAGARFFMAAIWMHSLLSTVGPCNGGKGWPAFSAQSRSAYPGPAQSVGPGRRLSVFLRAFPRADRRPGFCREHLAGWGPVRLRPGCGRKRGKSPSCPICPSERRKADSSGRIKIYFWGTKIFDRAGRLLYTAFHDALVAQLDRATGYEPVGQEFESLRAHHNKNKRLAVTG